jgi:EAL domain-containing protein (putative c-di-GMP-specific phosphodiesterase class I)
MILVKDGQRAIEPAALAAECVSDWWLLPVETVRLAARLARLQEEVGAQNHAALHPTMALQGAAAGLLQGAQLLDLQETAWRLKADLRTGLAQHAFYYDFQPIFGAQTGELCGYEALLRWNCNGHVILPAKFLPLIAESGLLAEIQSALLAPIAQLLATADYGGTVSINWSPALLCDYATVSSFAERVLALGLDPARIVIEITESAAMRQLQRAQECLVSLKDYGFKIALDDFGRGHGGLSYLCNLPIDIVKVDGSLVRGLSNSPRARRVLQGIVDVAHCLGQRVVAEGVETLDQLSAVGRVGCDQVQGFLVGPPAGLPEKFCNGDPELFGVL